MTNLLAMTTVQWAGAALLSPLAFCAIWMIGWVIKEEWKKILPWAILLAAFIGTIMLCGCKPIDHDPEQSPEPTPTMVSCVDDEDVSDDVLTRTCWYADGVRVFAIPVDELKP
jgi:hypothetical protein